MRINYQSPELRVVRVEPDNAVLASSTGILGDYTHSQMYWDVESDNEFE